jgi:Na+/H+-dicarboxylate symporter
MNSRIRTALFNPFFIYLVMIVLGIISGSSGVPFLQSLGFMISDIFIKIFKCISMPIVALSIIVTLSQYHEDGGMTNVWHKTLLYTFSTTIIAATVGCFLYLLIQPTNVALLSQATTAPSTANVTYWQHVSSLIPSNIFAPFIEHQVMGVLLIGIVIGLAIRHLPDKEAKEVVKNFFKGIYGLFFVITKWVVAILPIGLYGFITVTVVELNKGMNIAGIGEYLSVIVLANLVQGFIILPAWLWLNNMSPLQTMRKMLPALSVAFFSKSSTGTLPVTMNTVEKNLHVNPKISRFVLPLCTSINMNGCAAFIFVTVMYLMQNHGVDITYATMACWIIIATIAAIGNAGVPMGCFFLSASLLTSMNIPIVLLGIILPFYGLIDMLETSLNVWSDACVVNVVNKTCVEDEQDWVKGQEVNSEQAG